MTISYLSYHISGSLKTKCTKSLNLLRVLAHTTWGADQETLLHLYRSLIRSKLDYGCVVNGSARRMLDPIQNHYTCAYVWVLSGHFLLQACVMQRTNHQWNRDELNFVCNNVLKRGSTQLNPTHNVVFNAKFKSFFERKPKQIPPLSIRVS